MQLFPDTIRESIVDAGSFLVALARNTGGLRGAVVAMIRRAHGTTGAFPFKRNKFQILCDLARDAYPELFVDDEGGGK